MKTNTTHCHVRRTIPLVLLALGAIGLFCWLLLSPGSTPTTRGPTPGLVSLPTGLLARVAFVPGQRWTPLLVTGPVADAADATSRAVVAANGTARSNYGVEPFADPKATATFDGRRWCWRKRVGYGRGDLEAEVTIAPDGTVESVAVRYTTQQFAGRI